MYYRIIYIYIYISLVSLFNSISTFIGYLIPKPALLENSSVTILPIVKVKLATVVEGDQKAPFSIATIQRRRGGCYSFPWIAPLYS